ncbi:aflatoxin regulatory protein-domain-containing protein [Penicillium vulpinum]|uniref:Zn(2)-C6 fungal-type domain-containing protein n=1 Tax=Penicillium vulpinum TaxID=29845 RepID=A0A1V6S9K2_9EURO|nr:aflatoxin regulatory protein-domain-containing protein [Penicillium vulpinum]KAJ5952327.1 aflatoxin regulatory protein-domain-containing protein [Penicillium vulpinum]OQE10538.1 hypothetical protein PENVUL_c004G02233 [Penicillium vulpinum]
MSHTPPRQTNGSTTNKLRDSCHACALSKVKCHKEKPTCSRCARRNITCEYFVTKRPGRKLNNGQPTSTSNTNHNSRQSTSAERSEFQTVPGLWPDSTHSASDAALSTPKDNPMTGLCLTPTSMSPGRGVTIAGAEPSSSSSDDFSCLSMPMEPTFAGISNEFDDFFPSSIDFLELDTLETNSFMQENNDLANLLIPDETNYARVQEAAIINRPKSHAYMSTSPSLNARARPATHTHTICCLMQALELLKPSSSKAPASPVTEDITTSNDIVQGCYASAQTVVMENKQTIEAVSNMLQCSCTEDGYILVMLSMIVFQVLRRYAAVAQNQSGGVTQAGGSSSTNDQSVQRMAAQLILSELHRVQQLVNQLSPRLNPEGAAGAERKAAKTIKESFSPTTLTQIEIDLRKCITTVSSVVINMLRQF